MCVSILLLQISPKLQKFLRSTYGMTTAGSGVVSLPAPCLFVCIGYRVSLVNIAVTKAPTMCATPVVIVSRVKCRPSKSSVT